MSFKLPRRPAVRPYSEPIERDDDGETAFVTGMIQQQKRGWGLDRVQPAAKGRKKKVVASASSELFPLWLEEEAMLRAMSDADFKAWLVKEGVAGCYIGDVYPEDRKSRGDQK